ncbi:MAG: hypothetical protein EHM13_14025 [Acidobacteria bacterium]|nr:MAG: hypothetical protein EHM13_14025 [Acidobacteriota bacterium]
MDARTFAPGVDRTEVVEMSEQVVRMLLHVRQAFVRLDPASFEEARRLGRAVHLHGHALIDRLVSRTASRGAGVVEVDQDEVFIPMHLGRIADNIELLGLAIDRMVREGTPFTDRANREVRHLFDGVLEMLEGLRDALRTGNRTLVRYIQDAGKSCEAQANEYALFHEQRLIEGVCQPRSSSIYLAMLDHLKGVEWHARQVAEKLQPPIHIDGYS